MNKVFVCKILGSKLINYYKGFHNTYIYYPSVWETSSKYQLYIPTYQTKYMQLDTAAPRLIALCIYLYIEGKIIYLYPLTPRTIPRLTIKKRIQVIWQLVINIHWYVWFHLWKSLFFGQLFLSNLMSCFVPWCLTKLICYTFLLLHLFYLYCIEKLYYFVSVCSINLLYFIKSLEHKV